MKKRDILLSVISGLLVILSLPKYDLEALAWFAIVPMFRAIEEKKLTVSFLVGLTTGFVSYLGILYWVTVAVHIYGGVHLVPSIIILLLLVAYLSLYLGIFALLLRYFQCRLGIDFFLSAPPIWVSLEYVRSFLLTGFPWANLGHSQYLNLPVIQISDLTGVYGISFILVLVNASIHEAIKCLPKRSVPVREAVITFLVVSASILYGYSRIQYIDRFIQQKILNIGLVQGNIDQSIKWDEAFRKETLRIYERLSVHVASSNKLDLIIWPETATPFFFQDASDYSPLVLGIARKTGSFLLFGTPTYSIEGNKVNHYNSALLVSPEGKIIGKYDKIHLVPFGEYVPFSNLLFFIGSLGEGIGNFKPGKEFNIFLLSEGSFGTLICFEIIFPELARTFVNRGAQFLVTITNDAWFGMTSAPYQHFAIATFRAVENRVYVARAANTGISGIIDPNGRITKKGRIFTQEAIKGSIGLMNEKTFYTLYGDVFAWLCSALTAGFLFFSVLRSRA